MDGLRQGRRRPDTVHGVPDAPAHRPRRVGLGQAPQMSTTAPVTAARGPSPQQRDLVRLQPDRRAVAHGLTP
ncbi:hypothetical protein [Streptomyces sp. NPDC092370]|uniref:hypothetical protein n=1 Tax=Streptomyces sp. NPDC092370 TaxID=3366016 RepID=UPI0038127390